jgi:hypothetical protein
VTQPPGSYGYGPYGYGPYGYGPPPPPPVAPRPGCVPLRPLGVGDILDGAFRATRRNPRVMLGLSAGFAVVEVLLTTGISLLVFHDLAIGNAADSTGLGGALGNDGLQLLALFVTMLLGGVLTGMLSLVVTQDVLGRKMNLTEVWAQTRPRVWTLAGLALVTTVLSFLGLALCIAPGIWLWGIWAVAVPACMVERTTVGGALGRSRQLVSGTFWRVWGIRALGWLVLQVVASLITVPFLVLAFVVGGGVDAFVDPTGTPVAFLLVLGLGSLIGATLTAPIRAGVDALLYVDLRMRKEGLDIALQASAAPAAAPPSMTAW